MVTHTAVTFTKYFLSIVFEAVTMALPVSLPISGQRMIYKSTLKRWEAYSNSGSE